MVKNGSKRGQTWPKGQGHSDDLRGLRDLRDLRDLCDLRGLCDLPDLT